MRAVIQRVKMAAVKVDEQTVGKIEQGLLVFLGVGESDEEKDLAWILDKICGLRIFEDMNGKMNLSLEDTGGAILLVSQFTLYGDCRKGKRPSFSQAARPERAKNLFDLAVADLKERGIEVQTGIFQADMAVELVNDGPVTLLLDSEKKF